MKGLRFVRTANSFYWSQVGSASKFVHGTPPNNESAPCYQASLRQQTGYRARDTTLFPRPSDTLLHFCREPQSNGMSETQIRSSETDRKPNSIWDDLDLKSAAGDVAIGDADAAGRPAVDESEVEVSPPKADRILPTLTINAMSDVSATSSRRGRFTLHIRLKPLLAHFFPFQGSGIAGWWQAEAEDYSSHGGRRCWQAPI